MSGTTATRLRRLVLRALPDDPFETDLAPKNIYFAEGHWKALHPQRPLVLGDRGTGKTFWWQVLSSRAGGQVLSAILGPSMARIRFQVRVAYGTSATEHFEPPGQDTLERLFAVSDPRPVWKTLLMAPLFPEHAALRRSVSWEKRVTWVAAHPEQSDRMLRERDRELLAGGEVHLLLIDAVDRMRSTWSGLVHVHRALLSLLLEFTTFQAIRVKAFLRSDLVEEPEVTRFPDASKLLTAAVSLRWTPADLYGLLWQRLGNAAGLGKTLRDLSPKQWGRDDARPFAWRLREGVGTDDEFHAKLWHAFAGRWMGANSRRGHTYTWLPKHLADARGQASPRSFLAAVRRAAEKTPDDNLLALSPRAIQEGVRGASEIRAREIVEDFPWMSQALGALGGVLVPNTQSVLVERWEHDGLLERLDLDVTARRRRSHGLGLDALVGELVTLGVMQRLPDDRINVPDVYRLGFRMHRRGGVRPTG
jgi:hypothetical protein